MRGETELISTKSYWKYIDNLLSQYTLSDLQQIIKFLAEEVAPRDRSNFLDKISILSTKSQNIDNNSSDNSSDKYPKENIDVFEKLLDKISAFKEDVLDQLENASPDERYDYSYRNNYDDDEDDESDCYSELTNNAQEFLSEITIYGKKGFYTEARKAYEELFPVFRKQDDYGRGLQISAMENDYIKEYLLFYLVCVYESTPLNERSNIFHDCFLILTNNILCRYYSLTDVMEVTTKELSNVDEFLPLWIDFLKTKKDIYSLRWLREAIEMKLGIEGLEKWSINHGKDIPMLYISWIESLKKENRYSDIVNVCNHALEFLPSNLPLKANICDELILSTQQLKNNSINLSKIRLEAFMSKPTITRLLDLWESENELANKQKIIQNATSFLTKELVKLKKKINVDTTLDNDIFTDSKEHLEPEERKIHPSEETLIHALLLSNKYTEAIKTVDPLSTLGWSSSSSRQALVIGIFLRTASSDNSIISFLQDCIRNSLCYEYNSERDEICKKLISTYTKILSLKPIPTTELQKHLCWVKKKIIERVDEVVGNKHRGAYERVALAVTACSDAIKNIDGDMAAYKFYESIRNKYPRHTAFQKELKRC
ncbi:MAG: hypothetical protein HQK49_22275 [Oligoflexia bacterium]|nr:hypothetical protein [Oligoflexia bacterium]